MVKAISDLILSIAGAYLLLIIVKGISYWRIRGFIGKYKHFDKEVIADDKVYFVMNFLWLSFLSPIPTIAVKIERLSLDGITKSDWKGIYVSDILNPFYFKGTYIIKDDYIKTTSDGDQDGWHELNFFNSNPKKIGLTLHYLKNKKWVNEDGYFIAKKE